ncbi:uncharacterized protein LOC119483941 isoform X2 [Sebastes umbrosus]|uniref:uncharacterized protein LOC119483941 isoform X2 n=1 Tax=Sebastes umbrosus TaxID=72105 RepID=UPI00189DBFF8|nr:uncharacterized protein LOC119483941 isoform X2 [Sebastes umbrosus]
METGGITWLCRSYYRVVLRFIRLCFKVERLSLLPANSGEETGRYLPASEDYYLALRPQAPVWLDVWRDKTTKKCFNHQCFCSQWPELTVESLPSFLSRGEALLLLFMGEEDKIGRRQNQALLEEMRGERMEPYLACWIYLDDRRRQLASLSRLPENH